VDRFQDYVDDVLFFREMVGTRHPGAKVVLIGHSLGGLIALAIAARHGDRFAAVTVSGPPLRLALEVPGWKATLGKILSGIAPKFAMTNELDPGDLARNPEVGRKYVADPLVERKVTARFFISLTEGMAETAASAASVRIPACIMHGTADRLTHFEGSRLFYDGLGDIPKALKLWDGFYHELFQEDEKEDVFREVLSFLVDQGLVAAA
jgi:alpha-beta hydrolase superfamily lysophospholipase